jgi:phenylacetate-CoA ligase
MEKFTFFKYPPNIEKRLSDLKTKPAEHWLREGRRQIDSLIKFVLKTTPAYRKFLKDNDIDYTKIKGFPDLQKLPIIDKNNYLRKYDYLELFPNKDLTITKTISGTSGSTGEPFYFPRINIHDDIYQHMSEIFLREQFEIGKKSTLGVLGFGLGIWIGGIFTYKVMEKISQKGYRFTIAPTGTNIDQFLKVIKKFGNFYDQIILMGYPPFIKDVLDEGREYGIKWQDYNIKILTAAEGFSERFREYIAKKAHLKNIFSDIINIYGTVEFGTMAHETPLSNLIRNLAISDKKLFKELFPEATNVPTLCQYYPDLIYFEQVEIDGKNEVIATGYGTQIPLIRYRFKDLGGVISYEIMMEKLKAHGINIQKELKRYNIKSNIVYPLPFVYVYARSDFTVVFRGANIYPEEIRYALDDYNLTKYVTGRFTMIRKEDRKLNQILEINVELRKGVKPKNKIAQTVQEKIITHLCKNNSEYNYLYVLEKEKVYPTIVLRPYQYSPYFTRLGKQPWVKK